MQNNVECTEKHTNFLVIIITFIIVILGYIAYLLLLSSVNNNMDYGLQIFILNWIGIILFVYIIISWYKLTNMILSPYIIFMSFFFLFNFGQCLMWSFGIHSLSEIGMSVMYRNFGIANDSDILKAQGLTLTCILMFHFGALICYKSKKRISCTRKRSYKFLYKNADLISLKAMYYACLIMGIIVIPITIYYSYSDFQIARAHGYGALYYSEFARTSGSISMLLSNMFFPCLIGLLLGSGYNKKTQKIVYMIFFVYLIINLLFGDRGTWIYKVFILMWLSNACYKSLNFKLVMKYLIIGVLGLYIVNVIVSFRSIGLSNVSIETIFQATSLENSPIISAIFEMGGSMKPTIILQKYGWNVWPYANSYLLAMLGMITNKLIYVLGIPFELLSSWFSQGYLGISWGAGFSIIAEVLLNFGPVLSPLFMILQGYIIGSIIYIDKNINYKERPLRFFFAAASLNCFVNLTRNELHIILKSWFYGVIILYIIILMVRAFIIKKQDV